MSDNASANVSIPKRVLWNKDKLTGAKLPLRQKHVWAIRTLLRTERRTRKLATFNLAFDSKLRGCGMFAIRVGEIAPNGYAIDRATGRQKRPADPCELS